MHRARGSTPAAKIGARATVTAALSPGTIGRIRRSFAAQRLMASLGADLVALAPGRVSVAAPIWPASSQQHGSAHASLTFAVGDSAASYAALSLMPDEAEVLTVEMKINLLSPAAGDRLVATGRVVRAGRRPAVVAAGVRAETRAYIGEAARLGAILQGTMISA